MIDKRDRINWLLILQGWAMLWVVIGHAFIGDLDSQANWPIWERSLMGIAYSFHMPLFMLVSGWLFFKTRLVAIEPGWGGQEWTYSKIIKDKALRILLPGLFFSIIALVTKLALSGEVSRQAGLSVHEIVVSYLYPFNNPFRELWFVVALFWMFMLTPIWRYLLKIKWTTVITIVVLLVLHFFHPQSQFLALDKTCLHALWFFMGLVLSKERVVENLFNKTPLITLLTGAVFYVIGYLFVISFMKTVGGIIFSFGLAIIADRYTPKIFFGFRNYTYQIFLMGIFAQMLVKIIYKYFPISYVVAYLICIVVGLYVPVLVSKLIEKINWKPLSLCVGLKTK